MAMRLVNEGLTLSKKDRDALIAKQLTAATDIDSQYLHALYFPESSDAARIPTRFGMPSATFTQRFSFYLNTGVNGSGFVGIAPQDSTFYSCFRSSGNLVNELDPSNGSYSNFHWEGESGTYIAEKFSHSRLVGCSMRTSYIGTKDEESGFMCSSHIFTASPLLIDEQMVENGFFVRRSRPSEGSRLVYIPKDDGDLEFCPQEFKFSGTKATEVTPQEWFASAGSNALENANNDTDMRLQVKQLAAENNYNLQWGDVDKSQMNIAPSWFWGQHEGRGRSQNPHLMVLYWRGLPANKEWFRVDVERHFEGIPRMEIKDLVAVAKPKASQKTIDFVKKRSQDTILHNHDLDDHSILEHSVKPVIHAVVDQPQIVAAPPKQVEQEEPGFFSSLMTNMLPTMGSLAGGALGSYFGNPMLGASVGNIIGQEGSQILGGSGVAQPTTAGLMSSYPTATKGGGTPYTGNPSARMITRY